MRTSVMKRFLHQEMASPIYFHSCWDKERQTRKLLSWGLPLFTTMGLLSFRQVLPGPLGLKVQAPKNPERIEFVTLLQRPFFGKNIKLPLSNTLVRIIKLVCILRNKSSSFCRKIVHFTHR